MSDELANYYHTVGFCRGSGLSESQAHAKAEEAMEDGNKGGNDEGAGQNESDHGQGEGEREAKPVYTGAMATPQPHNE